MDYHAYAGYISGGLALFYFLPYNISIIRGSTVPSRVTWFLFSLAMVLIAASQEAGGAVETKWMMRASIIGDILVLALSFLYGTWGGTTSERIFIGIAFASIIPWVYYQSPLATLAINLFIDMLGIAQMIKKVWRHPETEDLLSWGIFFAASVANLFAIRECIAVNVMAPATLFLGNGVIFALTLRQATVHSVSS